MADKKAVSTIGTVLEVSADGTTWEKMTPIKSYPALGGEREQLETTDMEDETQTFVPGVQTVEVMSFTANYLLTTYLAVKAKAMTDLQYRLKMGKDGEDGVVTWSGKHDVYKNEGEVNGIREMTITVYPSTQVTVAAATTA